MDTSSLPKSRLSFKKEYEGTEDQLTDLAITLHSFLKIWRGQHPKYDYILRLEGNHLYLTIKNNKNENNTSV